MQALLIALSILAAPIPPADLLTGALNDPLSTDPVGGRASRPYADASIGVGLSWPEIALIYGSYFPGNDLSIDGMFTLSTVDAGLTYHAPLGGIHYLLLQGMVGYVHAINETSYFDDKGIRFFLGGGYGALASFDFRAVVGFSAEQISNDQWGYIPAAFLMLGKVF